MIITQCKQRPFVMVYHDIAQQLDPYGLAVYVALTSFTDKEKECFPSISRIAKRANTSPSTCKTRIDELEKIGLVKIVNRFTDLDRSEIVFTRSESHPIQISNLYVVFDEIGGAFKEQGTLPFAAFVTDEEHAAAEERAHTYHASHAAEKVTVQQAAGGGSPENRGPVAKKPLTITNELQPKNNINTLPRSPRVSAEVHPATPASPQRAHTSTGESVPRKTKPGSYTDDFEDFWAAYPRKVAKRNAYKAWVVAIKRASTEQIITGATRYAASSAHIEERFIPHPATWLNGDRFLDESEPPRKKSPAKSWLEASTQFAKGNQWPL